MRTNRPEAHRLARGHPQLRLLLSASASLLLAFGAAWSSAAATAASATSSIFGGGMRIGAEQFSVQLELQDRSSGDWISVAVTNPAGVVNRLAADLDSAHPTILVEGRTLPLDPDLARQWSEALRSEFYTLAESDSFRCTERTDRQMIFESRGPITLTEFLAARVRLVYEFSDRGSPVPLSGLLPSMIRNRKLARIDVFSLPDWLNGFGDHVSLVLIRRESGEGGVQ